MVEFLVAIFFLHSYLFFKNFELLPYFPGDLCTVTMRKVYFLKMFQEKLGAGLTFGHDLRLNATEQSHSLPYSKDRRKNIEQASEC